VWKHTQKVRRNALNHHIITCNYIEAEIPWPTPFHFTYIATQLETVPAQSDQCQCAVIQEKLNHYDSRIKMLLRDLFLNVVARLSGRKHILGVTTE